MPFSEQVQKLVDRLTELTAQGKVKWGETADEQAFQASVQKFIVVVTAVNTYSGDREYHLRVQDQHGKILEELGGDFGSLGGERWNVLQNLHEAARRQALHVDEALTDLLSSLEQIH